MVSRPRREYFQLLLRVSQFAIFCIRGAKIWILFEDRVLVALLFPAINVNSSQIFLLFFPVLVRKATNGKAELVLLDHGLYEYLPPSVRQPLCRLWKAIVMNNHFDMETHARELGVKGNVSLLDVKHSNVNML